MPQVRATLTNTQDSTDNQSIASSSQGGQQRARTELCWLPGLPRAAVTDLPVSIEGGVVKRGVSSAVHAIHIRASPDTVKKREDF